MSSYILFLLLGLGSGAVYAVLGLGLVLKYRSAGVVDFAHGAVAMFCAYVYIELRSNGELQFPWILIPHQVKVASSNGMAVVPSILITLVYSAILVLVFSPGKRTGIGTQALYAGLPFPLVKRSRSSRTARSFVCMASSCGASR